MCQLYQQTFALKPPLAEGEEVIENVVGEKCGFFPWFCCCQFLILVVFHCGELWDSMYGLEGS